MPTSGTATEKDNLEKPPAAKQVHGNDHGVQSWEKSIGTAPGLTVVQGEEKKEPEVDDFGLPVRPPRRRLSADTSENEEFHEANGRQDSESPRKPSISESISKTDYTRGSLPTNPHPAQPELSSTATPDVGIHRDQSADPTIPGILDTTAVAAPRGVSGWSHQALAPHREQREDHHEEQGWQEMPALAAYDLYDDDGRLVAREARESDEEANAYTGLGGAGKGYTRVQIDEDALSATSMDENTNYLFKPKDGEAIEDEDEQRDPLAQMQATKDLLTEGQRIAYVGVARLAMAIMIKELEDIEGTKGTKKELRIAIESMKMWSQQMMVRLYSHMEIDSSGKFVSGGSSQANKINDISRTNHDRAAD